MSDNAPTDTAGQIRQMIIQEAKSITDGFFAGDYYCHVKFQDGSIMSIDGEIHDELRVKATINEETPTEFFEDHEDLSYMAKIMKRND